MKDTKKKELLGMVCIILGALFVLIGLVFFIINNKVNLYAKKVPATVMSSYSLSTSDGKNMTMVELMYKVGTETVFTTYNYPRELKDGEVFLEVYYDVRKPRQVLEAGWTFEPLFLALLGLVVLLLGLYNKGISDFGIVESRKPAADAPERVKKVYELRQKIGNNIFPALGGFVFIAFGLVMLLTRKNNWMWIFIGIGIAVIFYCALDLIPAFFELRKLNIAKKFRGKVVGEEVSDKEKEKAKDELDEFLKKKEEKAEKKKDKKEDDEDSSDEKETKKEK